MDDPANWSAGLPDENNFAIIGPGTYQVDTTDVQTCFGFRQTGRTVVESASGSLASKILEAFGGLTVLNAANTFINGVDINTGFVKAVVHPGHGDLVISPYFYGVTSPLEITAQNDGTGHLELVATPGMAHAVSDHDMAVAGAVAEASFVHTVPDVF
ncbi:MAG: hypothetical protein ACREHE_16750 [Rhizomicrobium sp.]